MTVPGNLSSPLLATATGAAAAAEYVIPKSLRFNDSDSAYLSKTFSSAGNRRTWSFSVWVKRCELGTTDDLFNSGGNSTQPRSELRFKADDTITIGFNPTGSTWYSCTTSAVFRDPSAWYHIVVACDTTQSTSTDRLKLYVNGVLQTFGSSSFVSQNTELPVNDSTYPHSIGRYQSGASAYFNGLMADIQFVDGQALAPTDFGETRSSDGVWVPKEASLTSLNDGTTWSSDLTATSSGAYFATGAGAADAFDGDLDNSAQSEPNGSTITFSPTGGIAVSTSLRVYRGSDSTSSTVNVSVNGGGSVSFGRSSWVDLSFTGTLTSLAVSSPSANPGLSAVEVDGEILLDNFNNSSGYGRNGFHLNFSDSSTNEALGFDSAPTTPDPDPKKGFDVVTYSGTSARQNIGGLNFEPGLLWIKVRSGSQSPGAQNHYLVDSVRGATGAVTKKLYSNSTGAENASQTDSENGIEIHPNGFALTSSNGGTNISGNNYVAWTWQAGGPAVSKTAGTINAEVSASTDYGFSICKFTGTGTAGTIEHGLSTVPKWYIVKNLDTSPSEWNVFHVSTGETKRLKLNSNSAAQTAANSWNDTAPTASLFTVGTDTDVNKSGDEHIAYVWSEVSGYSKFGTYEGASTVTVTTGFKPRWILLKNVDTAGSWSIFDSERDSDLEINHRIYANETSAEGTNTVIGNFTDTGFTLTNQGNSNWNTTGDTFVYAAFADRPGNNWDVNNIVTNEGLTTSKTQFDVVTYTGNGGTQKIGGPVFSASAASSITNASNIFDGSTSTGGYSSSTGTDLTLTTSSFTISTQLRVYNNFRSDGTYAICLNGTCVTVAGSGTDSTQYRWSTVDLSGFTLPLTVTSLGYSASQTSGNTIRAVEVDSSNLLDGTQPGLKFQPDFVWIKGRNAAAGHVLMDSVRGTGNKVLSSHNTAAEGSETYGQIQSFNTDGFTVEAGSTSAENSNYSNRTYVAWCWKAGGTAVSNTDGSITSSVSANAAYGFSVGTYTGTYSSQPSSLDTVGHGLNGKVPGMIISKSTNGTSNWHVWHKGLNNDEYIRLNSTNGKATLSTGAGGSIATAPTGTVFPTYYIGGSNNGSSDNLVFYCFADVPGYQRIGSYTGNGSSTGPVVVTGFKPRFLIVKRTDSTGAWVMLDSERNPANPRTKSFYADVSDAEYTPGQNWADFDESSFQLTATYGEVNASGATYIYLAIGDDEIGSDEDCLVDVPNAVTADADATDTTGGYQRGNYCTLNPVMDRYNIGSSGTKTFSEGNLKIVATTGDSTRSRYLFGTIGVSSGKWYYEMTADNTAGGIGVGFAPRQFADEIGGISVRYNSPGSIIIDGTTHSSLASFTAGDVIGVALDLDNNTVQFYKNGETVGSSYSVSTGYTYLPLIVIPSTGTSSTGATFNFGQMRFKYSMPTGHSTINTTALPAATIADGSAHFETVLWTGDNSASNRAITSSLAFSPDLVWGKERSEARSHQLYDAVRGAGSGKDLTPSGNYAEGYDSSTYGYLDSFDANGFTVAKGSNSSDGNNYWNKASQTYVAWTWNAGANSNKTYTVKVVSDSGNKYRFDDFGTSAVTLDLAEGNTYIFDQSDSSNSGHPLRFSTTSDGTHNSGTEYTTGVTTTGTPGSAGAKTTIVVGSGVATLYYYCSSHSGMGGQANTNSTAGSSNFDGSIQTTVKSNPEAGFSIIKYTGGSSAVTVGHELNATPTLFIQKNLDSTDIWRVYYTVADGSLDFMRLHTTGSKSDSSNTLPTSSVIYIGGTSGNDHILYAFTPVAGYSAFGSYTGNGSSDGPFVHTGFRPALVIIKRTDSAEQWYLNDAARDTFNVTGKSLRAQSTGTEASTGGSNSATWDILSNGFKLRDSGGGSNASGGDYIYMAWASNPFSSNGGLAR